MAQLPALPSRTIDRLGNVSLVACSQWLERAHDFTTDRSTRRLIEEVLDDLWALGSTDGELSELVIAALESVQAVIELDCAGSLAAH